MAYEQNVLQELQNNFRNSIEIPQESLVDNNKVNQIHGGIVAMLESEEGDLSLQ